MARYLAESDVLRREAEARAMMGGSFRDAFVPISSMQYAALPRNGKSLLLASVQGSLGFPLAADQTRR